MDEAIGSIDWPRLIEAAAASPLGMVALVTILVSVIGYFMLRGTSEHYRFIAFLMLFGGGVTLSMSVIDEKDFARQAISKTKAESERIPVEISKNAATQLASNEVKTPETTVQQWKPVAPVIASVASKTKTDMINRPALANVSNSTVSQYIGSFDRLKKLSKTPEVKTVADNGKILIRNRIKRIKYKNEVCSDAVNKTWTIKARKGWFIVPDSVQIKTALRSKKSRVTGVKYTAKDKVKVIARVVNSGKCRRALGINFKDRPGRMVLYVFYKETKGI